MFEKEAPGMCRLYVPNHDELFPTWAWHSLSPTLDVLHPIAMPVFFPVITNAIRLPITEGRCKSVITNAIRLAITEGRCESD